MKHFITILNQFLSFLHVNQVFVKEDSCVSQLLAITHKKNSNFDSNAPHETRGVFLDISKAFDRVWHE